jgi:hypothetical protein
MIKKILILSSYLKTAHYAESALLEKVIKESFIKNASQIDDAKKEYPEHSDKIDRLNSELNNARLIKYLSWSLEELIDSEFQEDPAEIVQVLKDYERLKSKKEVKEKIKDINSWGAAALRRFLDKVSETSQSIRNREKIKRDSESEIIYDSDNFTVILPKTHFASCQWTGKSTKWCVSMERDVYFTDYSNNNYFLYHIFNKDSALPDNDPNKRIAVPTIGDKFDQNNLVNIFRCYNK